MSNPSDFYIGCMNDEYPEGLRKEIETLHQQLEELKVNHKAELVMRDQNSQMYLDNTRQQLAESQAREKVLRDALDWINSRFPDVSTLVVIREVLAQHDSA